MTAITHKKKYFSRKSSSEIVVFSMVFAVFAVFAASYIYILLWGVFAGLKSHSEIVLSPFTLPEKWRFSNFIEVLTYLKVGDFGFFHMLFNSLYFSLLGPFIQGMVTSMLAYVTCKYKFFGAKVYYVVTLVVITLPIYGNTGSMYLILHRMGLINSYSQIILATSGIGMHYLFYYEAYRSLSDSYAEAAEVDGAGEYTIYFKVMFPQVRSLFLALFMLGWLGEWNNYSGILLYLDKLPTLAGGIYLVEIEMIYEVRLDMLYAAYIISAIPPLVIFALFNNVLTKNISLGGIKE